MEAGIRLDIEKNNGYDPTGKLNEVRIPPRRRQQKMDQPKWYDSKQHELSPLLSMSISAASVLDSE